MRNRSQNSRSAAAPRVSRGVGEKQKPCTGRRAPALGFAFATRNEATTARSFPFHAPSHRPTVFAPRAASSSHIVVCSGASSPPRAILSRKARTFSPRSHRWSWIREPPAGEWRSPGSAPPRGSGWLRRPLPARGGAGAGGGGACRRRRPPCSASSRRAAPCSGAPAPSPRPPRSTCSAP
jgi:hypothetical protein